MTKITALFVWLWVRVVCRIRCAWRGRHASVVLYSTGDFVTLSCIDCGCTTSGQAGSNIDQEAWRKTVEEAKIINADVLVSELADARKVIKNLIPLLRHHELCWGEESRCTCSTLIEIKVIREFLAMPAPHADYISAAVAFAEAADDHNHHYDYVACLSLEEANERSEQCSALIDAELAALAAFRVAKAAAE